MFGKLMKRWAVIAVAVPVAATGARKLSESMERRRGPSRFSVLLRKAADMLQKVSGRMPGGRMR